MEKTPSHIDVSIETESGQPENVRVHQLKVGKFAEAAKIVDDEAAFTELCTAKPKGWRDSLSGDSLAPLWNAVFAANIPFFHYLKRKSSLVDSIRNLAG